MVPQKGGAQKNPQGTFKSKNTEASRGGPNSLHHTAKPVHFVCLTVVVKGIFQSERRVLSQLLVSGSFPSTERAPIRKPTRDNIIQWPFAHEWAPSS